MPGLAGCIARDRIGVAGHSMGGQSASMLLGAHVTDEAGTVIRVADERVKAGVLLAPTGAGGEHLTEMASRFMCLRTAGFDQMATPALTIVGERQRRRVDHARPRLSTDPYVMSPGPKSLLTLVGGEHMLGGITGYDTAETTDENPERVAVIQRLSWAYFHHVLVPDSVAWERACGAFATLTDVGRLESK